MGKVDLIALITPHLEEAKAWIMRGYDRENAYTVLNLLPDALACVNRARGQVAHHADLTTPEGRAEEQRARILCLDVEARLHSGVAFAFAAFEDALNPSVIGIRNSHAKEALTSFRVPEMREVFEDADVLDQIAKLEDLLGNSDAALEAYRGVLKYDSSGANAAKARKRIAEIVGENEHVQKRPESTVRAPEPLKGSTTSTRTPATPSSSAGFTGSVSESIPQWDAWAEKRQALEARNHEKMYLPLAFLLLFWAFVGFMMRTCDDESTQRETPARVNPWFQSSK